MKNKLDKIMIGMAVFYIIFPVILFFFGWLKLPIAFLGSMLLLFMGIRLINSVKKQEGVTIALNPKFWLIAFLIIAVWVLFSGIGNFSFQTGDFIIRNPMFRDLERYKWPVIYDLSQEPDVVRQFTGENATAMYVYYFTWWLPAAWLARIMYFLGVTTANVEIYANIALYIWAVLGLFLTFYCLVRYLKIYSYWILASFILFGGMDFVMFYIINMRLPSYEHIEWWAGGICAYFQYSSNTTQLYWVFNQSIPIWLIVSVLLLIDDNKYKAAWSCLAVAYSPYATIAMVPIAICALLQKNGNSIKKRITRSVSVENILVVAIMAIVFVPFYLLELSAGTASGGFLFKIHGEYRTFTLYIIFMLAEFLVYIFVMGKDAFKYKFYFVMLAELIICPLFKSGMNNDFTMRASIPALFLLMVMCLQYVFEMEDKKRYRDRRIMLIVLCIGYLVSVTEIQRNCAATLTLSQQDYIIEDVYSFGRMNTDNENQIRVNLNQYMSLEEEYKESFFYKYLMKK